MTEGSVGIEALAERVSHLGRKSLYHQEGLESTVRRSDSMLQRVYTQGLDVFCFSLAELDKAGPVC